MSQAFEGIRVVDFTQVVAGPFATQQLALLGAEIIKIEQRENGDQSRLLMSQGKFAETGTSPVFLGVNAGKRSLTLDLKHPEAKKIVSRLIERADVVIQNFRAGVIDRLGFGYEMARATNPRIIYCSISGYGQAGPLKDEAAYDPAVQATSGMMSFTGHRETGPVRAGPAVIDLSTGLTAAYAISGALFRRERTGEGQFLDVAMYDTAFTMMTPNLAAYLIGGGTPKLNGNQTQALIPTADVFPTADGFLQVAILTDAHVKLFCETLGRGELLTDPRFASYRARIENGAALRDAIVEVLLTEPTEVWLTKFKPLRLPVTPVNDITEAVKSEQLAHRDVLMELPPPRGLDDPIVSVGAGFMTSADGPRPPRTPPALGEHTEEVLRELDFSDSEIATLRETQVV